MNDRLETLQCEQRIRDIRRRIAELRAELEDIQARREPSSTDGKIQEPRQSVERVSSKEAELNDIRAKLMSKTKKL